jgi:hypothetical protein
MSLISCRYLAILLLTASLSGQVPPTDTVPPQPIQPTSSTTPAQTYDQIVRLSFVEGDVRISRGKEGEHASGGAWGQAATGTPIETGFSLVTGKGRAEIELEDASTVYLGEDSVMTFNELTATGGIPHTDVTLVSGTATLNVRPTFPGEGFVMRTEVGNVTVRYPNKNFLRVNSYLDAMAVTPQEDSTLHNGTAEHKSSKGETTTYNRNGHVVTEGTASPSEFAAWDDWTAKRIAARDLAVSATMKEAGLSSPIPGLAEMKDQGTFFACAPYGTCWQPTSGWGEYEAAPVPLTAQSRSDASYQRTAPPSAQALQSGSPSAILRTEDIEPFPCSPNRVRRLIARDPATGRDTILRTDTYASAPYDWAVCHAGTWIHHDRRYVWVAGTKRHHQCPVHWVKYGNSKAYVPIHPHDVAGKAPINLKHGVFQTTGRKGESVEHVAFNAGTPVKLLPTAPKEFLRPYFPTLQHAETPHLEAHLVKGGLAAGREGGAKSAGTPITFDHRSQTFQLARQVVQGGRSTTVTERFGGTGNGLQAHNGGGSSFNGSSGSRSGGSNGGSFSHGSSNSGGGAHSSFSGGGGGGFHGGSSGGGGGGGSHSGGGGGGSAGGGSHK